MYNGTKRNQQSGSHYPLLNVTSSHYSSLNVTEHHNPLLNVTNSHYSSLDVTIHHQPLLNVTTHHYPLLDVTSSHQTLRDIKRLYGSFADEEFCIKRCVNYRAHQASQRLLSFRQICRDENWVLNEFIEVKLLTQKDDKTPFILII